MMCVCVCVCVCVLARTYPDHTQATFYCVELPVEADRSRESGSCVCWLSFHSLVGQGTRHRRRLGSASYRHRNNESSSVSEIALLSLRRPKALPVCPVRKTLTAERSTVIPRLTSDSANEFFG